MLQRDDSVHSQARPRGIGVLANGVSFAGKDWNSRIKTSADLLHKRNTPENSQSLGVAIELHLRAQSKMSDHLG